MAREERGEDAATESNPRAEGRRERSPRGENRRGERPARQEEQLDTQGTLPLSEQDPQLTPQVQTSNEDNTGERPRRSRDRYGRDRRERGAERGDRTPREEGQEPEVHQAAQSTQRDDARPVHDATARAPGATANGTTPTATARSSMPRVQPFTLVLSDLEAIAQQSGLQWVNSDAQRVAAVQAAIAAEPKPVHIPRERPAPVVLDEGPLVLVETRKDL